MLVAQQQQDDAFGNADDDNKQHESMPTFCRYAIGIDFQQGSGQQFRVNVPGADEHQYEEDDILRGASERLEEKSDAPPVQQPDQALQVKEEVGVRFLKRR